MTIRFATDDEIKDWNDLLIKNPDGGNIFQMKENAEVKSANSWKPRYITAGAIAILALEKNIPLLGKFWYLPKGPSVASASDLVALVPDLKAFAAKNGVFSVKIESELPKDEASESKLASTALVRSFPVQPNGSTVLIDLAPSLEDILMSFNQKGRHALRRAERDGVTVNAVELTQESIDTMYELMRQTAEGQWSLRPKEYLTNYWKRFTESGHGQMFFAYFEGQVVAASFGVAIGKNGTYKDGASIRKRTAYGASHLLQWTMMKWMKDHGVTHYDLCGVPPSDKLADETHYLHGVGTFKTSFNKNVVDFIGTFELPVNTAKFVLWKKIVERVVLRLHRKLNREEWY